MSTIIALVTFHAGLLAIALIPMSSAAEGRGERAKAHHLRTGALTLGLIMVLAQVEQWRIPLSGRIALAAIATAVLVLPLRHHPV